MPSRGLRDVPPALLETDVMHDLVERATALNPRDPFAEIQLWLSTKPPFASWFIRGEQATLNVGDSRVPLTGFKLPPGDVGVLVFFANALGASADYPNVTFEIDIDNVPLNGFASIIGALTLSIQEPWRVMEPLKAGSRAQVAVTNTGASQVNSVQAFLAGWYWTPLSGGA
jgi:hypothetical protein